MSVNNIPKELRHLRACLSCSLIKNADQFERDGCENCNQYFRKKHSHSSVSDYTSPSFDGLISAMTPSESWVCKWQRIDKFVPGVYAISVTGKLPSDLITQLENAGVHYRNRDTSTTFT